jgi:FKBP-type peptidyl-prolyl cis-trans isomerase
MHMKTQIATLGLGVLLGGTVLAAGGPPSLTDQQDKASYVIGYQYGANLLSRGVHVNPETFMSGLKQAQEGKPSAISPEETKAIHRALQMQVMAYRHQQYMQQAEKNLEAGKAFLAENAKKEGGRFRRRATRSRSTTGAPSSTAPSSTAPMPAGAPRLST